MTPKGGTTTITGIAVGLQKYSRATLKRSHHFNVTAECPTTAPRYRKSANSQRRTSPVELRSLRSRGPPVRATTVTTISTSTSRRRNTKTTTSVKTPRQSFPQQRALSMTSSVRSQRRFTRVSVTPMILRSARPSWNLSTILPPSIFVCLALGLAYSFNFIWLSLLTWSNYSVFCSFFSMLPWIKTLALRVYRTSASVAETPRSAQSMAAETVAPPRRRHRDAVSVLRALASCVTPHLGLPAYGCALEPWLGAPGLRQRSNRLALAAGRNAARHVARRCLANDLTALATEAPRIDCLMPLQTGESIREELTKGAISQQEAMERLLLLLAPKDAWALYKDGGNTKWDVNTLHRLLDLHCATNSGLGGPDFFENLPFTDRGSLPEPEELFYAAENRVLEAQRISKILKTPTNSSEESGTEEEVESGEELERDELEKTKLDAEEVLSAEPSSWHKGCPAEQLWAAHSNVLRSPAAYAAMIRGAARFGGADRAWELAEEAFSASHKLPLSVYNDLLRCAHECCSIDDVWLRLCRGFELLRNAKLPPNATTFTFTLHSLYKSNTKALRDGKSQDYTDKALGLLSEARRLGIQPTLGLYANLLRTVLTSRLAQAGRGYRLTELLADVLADLETRCWEEISRADVFNSTEDYDFANTAMVCAAADPSSASSLQLVQRVYDLIHTRCGDRRFLLRNSLEARNFYSRYLLAKLSHGGGRVDELRDLYHHHRQIFHADQGVYKVLVHRLKSVTARWEEMFERLKNGEAKGKEVDRKTLMALEASASLAFGLLGEMVFDFVAITTKLPQRLPVHISDSLMAFSFVDPWCEVHLSSLHSCPALRAISEAGSRAAHRAAAVFAELLCCQEARTAITTSATFISPLSTAELTALVRMALHPIAFNTGADGQQTVAQREANERALTCAIDLLMVSRGSVAIPGMRVSDVAAVEVLRACWLTGPKVMTERIWNLLGYLAGLKHLSEQCVQHVFVKDGSFERLLDVAEASLTSEGSTNGRGAETSPSPPRLQVVAAVRRKFQDHDTSSVSSR
ncbi:hypothetical protein TSMEX_003865 [Taenia solium]|eukprot:TsM_000266000 transcript=TsM_000266000 gene=TsM_000266000